ncbi:Sec-independent protein translocase TatA [Paracoccus liaowanqingii]|uniref:Sec-independent protein translocase protein TatA n=1 Tax=Paracoccus liaowanqingii TaxID=2560053 RepID=A0A4Z1C7L5_9RHOB|nr:twin-arginine translocase TatA/TatE family subunit [Paracoccus liaowanqingii]TGN47062.1 Sec-independent protein translocase TatA [Paracoccus liaowanqingii]
MLNNIGLPGLLLIAVVTLVLFGKGKVSSLMGEMGKGISAFKNGLKEDERDKEPSPMPQPASTAAAQPRQTEPIASTPPLD